MDRRGFLGTILALGVAPAIVRADSLMKVIPRETRVLLPEYPAIWTSCGSDFEQIMREMQEALVLVHRNMHR